MELGKAQAADLRRRVRRELLKREQGTPPEGGAVDESSCPGGRFDLVETDLAGCHFQLVRTTGLTETLAADLLLLATGAIRNCGVLSSKAWDVDTFQWRLESQQVTLKGQEGFAVLAFDHHDVGKTRIEGRCGLDGETYTLIRITHLSPELARTGLAPAAPLPATRLAGRLYQMRSAQQRREKVEELQLGPEGLVVKKGGLPNTPWDGITWDVDGAGTLLLRDVWGNTVAHLRLREKTAPGGALLLHGRYVTSGEECFLRELPTYGVGGATYPTTKASACGPTRGKTALINLLCRGTWGDHCSSLGYIAQLREEGFNMSIITGDWGSLCRLDKSVYDPLHPRETESQSCYTYHPHVEPVDFFCNLVAPTFDADYYDVASGRGQQDIFLRDFDLRVRFGYQWMTPHYYWLRLVCPQRQFDYRIRQELETDSYLQVQAELRKTRNVILYATWDESRRFEWLADRVTGYRIPKPRFEMLVEMVRRIDAFCLRHPEYRIVLFSKKAVDWERHLKSDYFDFRAFETFGLCFSQAFHLCARNAVATIGQCSSMQLWFNYQKDVKSIIYTDDLAHAAGDVGTHVRGLNYFLINDLTEDVAEIFD